jgi:hypothetical protein
MMHDRSTVAVIVGAGASVSAGAPTTHELLEVVLRALPTSRVSESLGGSVSEVDISMPDRILEALEKRDAAETDYEMVIAALEELLSYGMGPGPLIRSFTDPIAALSALFDVPLLFAAYDSAISAILYTFLQRTPHSPDQLAASEKLSSFFRKLGDQARLVTAMLNYDTLLDDALPWCQGFAQRMGMGYAEFDPLVWHSHVSARDSHLLMHVHGSLRFGLRPPSNLDADAPFNEPVLYRTSEAAVASAAGRGVGQPSADGQWLAASPIVAGGHKSSKLMHNPRPYAYYNATSLDEVVGADRLLIVGYGFRDLHVNAWIDEFTRVSEKARIAIVTKRTGADLGKSTEVERFLLRMAPRDAERNVVFEPVEGGAQPARTHGRLGRAYVVTTGMPMAADVEEAVLSFLRD